MSIIEAVIIGVSLSMDAFAISLCSGLKMARIEVKRTALIALFFGGAQAAMPAMGWALGRAFAGFVDRYDHYIAFALLMYLGVRMLLDAFRAGEAQAAAIDMKALFVTAVATGVDTLAVGVTFGIDPSVRILPAALTIGATTFVICVLGVLSGCVFGARRHKLAQVFGGAMLMAVAIKILLEGILV